MKIFVTVGTTPFDSLIQRLDLAFIDGVEFIFQISSGDYKPKNHPFFEFSSNIEKYYSDAEFIITHAGAGSIYRLLELDKRILVVPNYDRFDNHQSEISKFVSTNSFALSCDNLDSIESDIKSLLYFSPEKYNKDSFFKSAELIQLIHAACV